ncbi:uncharacterized protein B0P05DRAFT_540985 [Gilbertella persicaria]|uniref:uncharacterized protein n=1 Tax=Gilbertella persicaria TaxID=101096 RepID=UPI002220239B|nr:uncharacterized protein B0P05DRAFT_540985 [Gilbertella persicaria]KAI8079530.1 hypothetical protein B0P05DRAFT_540985 [Gilbertella persicaria]
MSFNAPSRSDAKKDQLVGNVKETAGNLVGNERLQAEGKTQHGQGQANEAAANIVGYAQGLKDQVTGAVQGAVHSLTGDNTNEASDKVQQKKGEAQKEINS